MKKQYSSGAHAGFTLVETMVALLVISVGLLGIAKMQALALSSTGTARMRSIAALQAASMAAAMHANRTYWAAITAADENVTAKASDGSFTTSDTTVAPPSSGSCLKTSPTGTVTCTAVQVAGQDITNWIAGLKATMPGNTTAKITCPKGTATTPVTCRVEIDWTENLVELNTGMNAADTAANNNTALQNTAATSFILFVEP